MDSLPSLDHENEENPGAQLIWFGKFRDEKRFDELPEDYIQTIMNNYVEGKSDNPPYLCRFYKTYHDYNAWLERRGQGKSPGSITVWFGKMWKGHEIRVLLDAPKRWRWFVKDKVFSNRLRQIEAEWRKWKKRHPRTKSTHRARPIISNPMGELLRPEDPPTDEDYDMDDGFIDDGSVDEEQDQDYGEDKDGSDEDDSKEGGLVDSVVTEDNVHIGSDVALLENDESPDEEETETPRRRPATRNSAFSFQSSRTAVPRIRARATSFSTDTSDSDDKMVTKKFKTQYQPPSARSSRTMSPTAHEPANGAVSLLGDDEDDVLITPRTRRRSTIIDGESEEEEYMGLPAHKLQNTAASGEISNQGGEKEDVYVKLRKHHQTHIVSGDSDDDVLLPRSRNRYHQKNAGIEPDTKLESEDNETKQISPRKRRRTTTTEEVNEDIQEKEWQQKSLHKSLPSTIRDESDSDASLPDLSVILKQAAPIRKSAGTITLQRSSHKLQDSTTQQIKQELEGPPHTRRRNRKVVMDSDSD